MTALIACPALPETVEDAARNWMAAVRRARPHVPYHQAGDSIGRVVAYEIAALLEAAGGAVTFAGLSVTGIPACRWPP